MHFNPDPTKPTQEVIFSRKKDDSAHPDIFFDDIPVERASHQKHLGIYLDEKPNFETYIITVLCKVNKGISIIKKAYFTKKIIAIYKVSLRLHIDYDDDHPSNESFCEKLESVQYKAALVITGAIQSTSREKNLLKSLITLLESLKSRRWFRRLCYMFNIMKNQALEYLNNLIPKRKQNFNSRNIFKTSYNC